MSEYPEYKPCEGDWIKEVPAGWEIVRGKYLFEIKKRIVGEVGHDVLSITQKGIKIKDTESGDGQLSMDYSKYQIVEPGDFAMNHMDLLTGYVDISKYQGVTSPDYRVFTSKEAASSPRYFLYVFQMGYTNKIFFKYGQGASHLGRWRLPTEEFNNFWFPCPPKEDRENIANFLDYEIGRIDTLIDKQQQLIKLLKEKRQAVISYTVTKGLNPNAPMRDSGIEWLGEVPEHWDVLPVKLLSSFVGTGGTPKKESSFCDAPGINWFTPGDFEEAFTLERSTKYVTDASCDAGDAKLYPAGSVLVVGIGATLGKVRYCDVDFSCNQQINIISPNSRVSGLYLMHSLSVQTEQMRQVSNASTIGIMNQEKTKQIFLAVPPKEESDEIVTFLATVHKKYNVLLNKGSTQVKLLQERRTALISAAVTGKIDVRNWQALEPSDNQNKEVAA